MPTHDEVRERQRETWADLAPGWDRWDAVIQHQLGPVGARMIELSGVGDQQRHLDVASGTGEPGLSVARIAPAGRVVLTDISPEMLEVARRRAAADGLGNVQTHVCSADDLPFDDASFDSVSMRFGYMFLPDLALATSELSRVLRPGGRLASSVWVDPERNPWTTVVLQAVATEVELPAAEPDAPGMYRCAAPGRVAKLYAAAGLHEIEEHDVALDLVTTSPQEYWDMISEHVSLVAAALRHVDDEQRARIAGRTIEAVAAYQQPDGRVHVPGAARVVVGTR
ncbi:MAG TPA: methyltransferase domain-containing protein [Candidatus Nanopelagicales bacterium]|nr:methyltransferase domain-containing protein [Candidatus Nanopelagicales bacterium]